MSAKEGSVSKVPSQLTAGKRVKGKRKAKNQPVEPVSAEYTAEDVRKLLFPESFCKEMEGAMHNDFAISVAWSKNSVDLMSAIRDMGHVTDPNTAERLYALASKHASMASEPTSSSKNLETPEESDFAPDSTFSEESTEKEMLFFTSPIPDFDSYPVLGPLTGMFQKHLCLSAHRTYKFVNGHYAQPGELRQLQNEYAASNIGYKPGFLRQAVHKAVKEAAGEQEHEANSQR